MSGPSDLYNEDEYYYEKQFVAVYEAKQRVESVKKRAIFWIVFNVALFTGGAYAVTIGFEIIFIGILLICPYSIVKNFWKVYKAQKLLKELEE